MQNDAPHQTQCQLGVAVHDVVAADVDQLDLSANTSQPSQHGLVMEQQAVKQLANLR